MSEDIEGKPPTERPHISDNDLTILQNLHRHGKHAERDVFIEQLAVKYKFNLRDFGVNMMNGEIIKIPESEK